MSPEFLWGITAFALAMSATPGPNNTIAFATGLNYGLARSMPYTLGVSSGIPVLIAAVAFGAGALLARFPGVHAAISYGGAAYILYLAWKVGTAAPNMPVAPPRYGEDADGPSSGSSPETPARHASPASLEQPATSVRCPTFLDGVLFQWLNPKAWLLAVTGVATYVGPTVNGPKLTMLCLMFVIMCLLSMTAWSWGGALSGRCLRTPRAFVLLNRVMGLLLASSVVAIFRQGGV